VVRPVAVDRVDQVNGGHLDQVIDGYPPVGVALRQLPSQRQISHDQTVGKARAGRIVGGHRRVVLQERLEPGVLVVEVGKDTLGIAPAVPSVGARWTVRACLAA
jgi:hypothetical protein